MQYILFPAQVCTLVNATSLFISDHCQSNCPIPHKPIMQYAYCIFPPISAKFINVHLFLFFSVIWLPPIWPWCIYASCFQGHPSPLKQWCIFPPISYFPYFQRNFWTPRKISPIWPFPTKFPDFHPPKFMTTFFLVVDHRIRISPHFSV